MKPIVLLDVDGVLADFIGANIVTLLDRCGREVQRDAVTQWDCAAAWGLSPEERGAMKSAWSEPGFCAGIPPYPGAVEAVRDLRRIADVYAVTAPMSRNPTWMHERREWLVDLFGFAGDADIVQTAAKHLVRGDVFVEDKASTLQRWSEAWPEGGALLWWHPYNAFEAGRHVRSWSHVVGIVDTMAHYALERDGKAGRG